MRRDDLTSYGNTMNWYKIVSDGVDAQWFNLISKKITLEKMLLTKVEETSYAVGSHSYAVGSYAASPDRDAVSDILYNYHIDLHEAKYAGGSIHTSTLANPRTPNWYLDVVMLINNNWFHAITSSLLDARLEIIRKTASELKLNYFRDMMSHYV